MRYDKPVNIGPHAAVNGSRCQQAKVQHQGSLSLIIIIVYIVIYVGETVMLCVRPALSTYATSISVRVVGACQWLPCSDTLGGKWCE